MFVTMQVDVKNMRVIGACTGEALDNIVKALDSGVVVQEVLDVVVGRDEFGTSLRGSMELLLTEHVPLGKDDRCLLRGTCDGQRIEVFLYFDPAEMNQGTVHVLE